MNKPRPYKWVSPPIAQSLDWTIHNLNTVQLHCLAKRHAHHASAQTGATTHPQGVHPTGALHSR